MKSTVILFMIGALTLMFQPTLGQAEMGVTDSRVMADVNLTLNPMISVSGKAHVANGIAMRNEARGTIALRGIPAGSSVWKALLYWNLSNTLAVGAATDKALFNGILVTGAKRADSADPCWAMAGNHTYRADVTTSIPKVNPNGDYEVVLLSAVSTSGQNPWNPGEAQTTRVEGATLIVIYQNANTVNNTVFLYDTFGGSMLSAGTGTFTLNHAARAGLGLFTMTGADGQRTEYNNSASNEIGKFNGAQISGPPAASSDWDGSAGWPLPQLWDVHTHNVTLNGASSIVQYIVPSDCVVPVAFVLQYGRAM